jgi:N-acetylmuramoyl-L-alanine amidase
MRRTIFNQALRVFFYGYLLFAICHILSGCATVPRGGGLPTYNIKGVTYLSVAQLCNLKGIDWEYDTFAQALTLRKDGHRINLRVGDNMVLVDGVPEYINSPVDIYLGAVVVPSKFKEQVLDVLYKTPSGRTELAGQTASISRLRTIVIDAGHGGKDPGTIGKSGLREKDVNLDIAKRLAKMLKDAGVNVIMTRSNDSFVPLSRRAEVANRAKADLFISIHANANRVRSLNGFEVYYVSTKANDSKRAQESARNVALDLDRSYFAGNSLTLKAIIWDLLYTYNRAESVELCRSLCRNIGRDLNTKVRGVKNANFQVLRDARMPAVLIEIGFLSNPGEERQLKNNFYRQEVAEALKQGIEDYSRGLPVIEASRQENRLRR